MKLCYTYVRATVGVSYASPAYYADRLCERGRAYLKNFFTPDRRSDTWTKYERIKTEKEADARPDRLKALSAHPLVGRTEGRGRQRQESTQERVELEREWERTVEGNIAREVYEEAVDVWRKAVKDLKGFEGRENPWKPSLDGHMFWM